MAFLFTNDSNSFMFHLAYGIKCYQCIGTEEACAKDKLEADKKNKVVTCGPLLDRCMRTWVKKDDVARVVNSCSQKILCEAAEKLCDDSSEGDCAVGCCETDECNAGSSVSFSVFMITVCSVLGLALLK